MQHFVLMGVSGCGKSSVGDAVALACGIPFIDGDDLHPKANIEKMSRGDPLDDNDRAPWLKLVGIALADAQNGAVIGCSALKKHYRDTIRAQVFGPVHFVHLHALQAVLALRVSKRADHFMPTSLLESQFADLEMLTSGEIGVRVDIDQSFAQVVADVEAYMKRTML